MVTLERVFGTSDGKVLLFQLIRVQLAEERSRLLQIVQGAMRKPRKDLFCMLTSSENHDATVNAMSVEEPLGTASDRGRRQAAEARVHEGLASAKPAMGWTVGSENT